MTTSIESTAVFVPMAPVTKSDIDGAEKLSVKSREALLMAVNGVRTGLLDVHVSFSYIKQTKTKPRIGGRDYVELVGTTGSIHFGKLVKADFNKKGALYLLVDDNARGDGINPTGWTAVKLSGLTNFQVTGCLPGPIVRSILSLK